MVTLLQANLLGGTMRKGSRITVENGTGSPGAAPYDIDYWELENVERNVGVNHSGCGGVATRRRVCDDWAFVATGPLLKGQVIDRLNNANGITVSFLLDDGTWKQGKALIDDIKLFANMKGMEGEDVVRFAIRGRAGSALTIVNDVGVATQSTID